MYVGLFWWCIGEQEYPCMGTLYKDIHEKRPINIKETNTHQKRPRPETCTKKHACSLYASIKRDLHASKKTNTHQKRPTHIKRDQHTSKETNTHQKRLRPEACTKAYLLSPYIHQKRPTHIKKDQHTSKEIYKHLKRLRPKTCALSNDTAMVSFSLYRSRACHVSYMSLIMLNSYISSMSLVIWDSYISYMSASCGSCQYMRLNLKRCVLVSFDVCWSLLLFVGLFWCQYMRLVYVTLESHIYTYNMRLTDVKAP